MHNKPDDRWTREELTLKSGNVADLAIAVIKQWHEDGEPKSDLPAILYWYGILIDCTKGEKLDANQTEIPIK